ncbi:MAG: chitobiase/beta-hexosaminidase C-terminal domain-containing protein, partial [Coriobacteriia bacterium]|nr:chitobiase/beta-hexosaminidase C-terminal domain-containing protein [Coriobacteriia bacterium]
SASTTYTAPFLVSGEGTNTIQYASTDGAGNVEATKTALVRIDRVAPTVGDNAPVGWTNTFPTILLSSADSGSGTASMLYSTDLSDPSRPYTPAGVVPSSEGTTTLRYKAIDAVGNVSATASATVLVDRTPPVTSDDATSGWVTGARGLHLRASDALSGVAFTECSIDGAPLTTQVGPVFVAGDGAHNVRYRSTDVADNVEQLRSTQVYIDSTPPSSSCNASATYTTTATISIVSTDALSGVAKTEYALDDQAWTTGSTLTTSAFGSHILHYRAVDVAGNVEATEAASFAIYTTKRFENTDPGITYQGGWTTNLSSSRSGGDWAYTNIAGTSAYMTFRGTAIQLISSIGSGFGIAKVTLDGTNSTLVDFYSPTSKHQQVCWTATKLAERNHTLKIEWTGTHNAASTSPAFGIDAFDITGLPVPDVTPPVTTSDASGAWRSTPATVTLTATDTDTFVRSTRYSINGSAGTTYTAPFAVSSEGTTTIQYASTDGAGNVEATKTALVRIDRVAPVSSVDATSGYVTTATINITPVDAGSGTAASQYSLDGSSWTTGSVVTTTTSGSHTLNYRSIDNLGNTEATKTAAFTVYSVSRFENTDPRIYYQGAWSINSSTLRSGGDWAFTNLSGTATYMTFHGMSASLISSKGPAYGIARVTLDSAETTMVDFYSSTSKHQQVVWDSGMLQNGDHTIKVEWTGTQNVLSSRPDFGIDAFDIAGAPVAHTTPPVTTATYQTAWQKAPAILSLSATDTGNFVRGIRYGINGSINTTYTAPLSFTADGQYNVYFRATDGAGNVEATKTALVRVDNTPPVTSTNATGVFNAVAPITLTASDSASGVSSTSYSLDGGGWKTGTSLSVNTTGTHTLAYASVDKAGNAEATKTASFTVASLTRIENTDPTIVFVGSWTTALSSLRSGGSWAYTTTNGSTATLKFSGTSVVLITTTGSSWGIASITVDGGTPYQVDLYTTASAHQKAVWSLVGLTNGPHTVTVAQSGLKNPLSSGYGIGVDAFDISGTTLAP